MSTYATLGGIALSGHTPITWALVDGPAAVFQSFIEEFDAASKIGERAAKHGGLDLVMPAVTVKKLYVTSIGPGDSPHSRTITMTDQRWMWARSYVVGSYNLRKRTGEIRVDGSQRFEVAAAVPGLEYASWSLNDGQPWKWRDVVADVYQKMLSGSSEQSIHIPDGLGDDVDVVDLDLDASGDLAMERVLALAGGLTVYVDYEGRAVVKDVHSGEELKQLTQREFIRGGHIGWSDRRLERPSSITVLFDREVELRFDYNEILIENLVGGGAAGAASGVMDSANDRPPRLLLNVLPQTEIYEPGKSRGSWIEINTYLQGMNGTYPLPPQAPGPLDLPFLRKSYLAPWWLKYLYVHDQNGNIDQVWARITSAARRHFRVTYQILPAWREKIRQLKAYRAAVVDEDTFGRGHAVALMDYTAFPTERSLFVRHKGTDRSEEGWEVRGWPGSGGALENGSVAPADVSIVDPDNGIIRIYLLPGRYGEEQSVIPGLVTGMPRVAPDQQAAAAFALIRAGHSLKSHFGLSTVVSAVMGSPNSSGRLEARVILPNDVKDLVGSDIGPCEGPPMTVRIGGSDRSVARFCWLDQYEVEIEEAFFTGTPWPEQTLLNPREIAAYARAAAARIYSSMLDRPEGHASFPAQAAVPEGSISTVEHRVSTNGAATTSIHISPQLVARDLAEFLPPSIRRTITGALMP